MCQRAARVPTPGLRASAGRRAPCVQFSPVNLRNFTPVLTGPSLRLQSGFLAGRLNHCAPCALEKCARSVASNDKFFGVGQLPQCFGCPQVLAWLNHRPLERLGIG